MAHIHIELPTNGDQEQVFVNDLKLRLEEFKGEDCRDFLPTLKDVCTIQKQSVVIGCGGSHIWIDRESDHVEGDIRASKRFAIVVDGKPNPHNCVYCLNEKKK